MTTAKCCLQLTTVRLITYIYYIELEFIPIMNAMNVIHNSHNDWLCAKCLWFKTKEFFTFIKNPTSEISYVCPTFNIKIDLSALKLPFFEKISRLFQIFISWSTEIGGIFMIIRIIHIIFFHFIWIQLFMITVVICVNSLALYIKS